MSRSTGHLTAIAPAICALVLLMAGADPAWAQARDPGIYGRAGVAVPIGDLGGFTETGPSLRVGVRFLDDGRFALVGEAGVELLSGERMDVGVVPVQAGVRVRLPAPGERLSASVLGLAGATFHQKGAEKPCPDADEDEYCPPPTASPLDDALSVAGRLAVHYRISPDVSAGLEVGVHHVPTAGPDGGVPAVIPYYEGTTTLPVHVGLEVRP